MNLPDFLHRSAPWLDAAGPQGQVVISTRVRMARNLGGFSFPARASRVQQREVLELCRATLQVTGPGPGPGTHWIQLNGCPMIDRQLLAERHLISRQHCSAVIPRAVAISPTEELSIMVNEEDHLRIQVLLPGSRLEEAFAQADRVDDLLESQLDYAFSPRYGYLTACPTNLGTGIRVSAMLHLPALKLTGEIEKVRRAAKDMHLAMRGCHGEGSDALGDLFQISNQTTLGRTEHEILDDFQNTILPRVIEYELQARQAIAGLKRLFLEDRIQRAIGILGRARVVGSEEAMSLLSDLRMGVCLGMVAGMDLKSVNELLLLVQPAHIQKQAGRAMESPARREFRAGLLRQRLASLEKSP